MLGFYPLSSNPIGGMPIESIRILGQNIYADMQVSSTLLKQVFLQGDVIFFETISVNLDIVRNLQSSVSCALTVTTNLQNIVNIRFESSIQFTMSAEAQIIRFVESSAEFKMMAYPILDVDNNTFGQPGGIPVEGFYPPNNVIFVLAYEDDIQITKSITSSIGNFTGYQIQNADLISIFLNDSIADVTVKTPYKLGNRISQFVSTKILEPLTVEYDYVLRFDQKVVSLSSQKFDIEGCSNAVMILDQNVIYAKNDFYTIEIGKLEESKQLVFDNLLIKQTDEIIIEARCELEDIPSPNYYQQVINTRVVDDKDQLGLIDLTSALRTAEPEEQFIELFVGQTNVLYKIIVLPNFDIDKSLILETVKIN